MHSTWTVEREESKLDDSLPYLKLELQLCQIPARSVPTKEVG